MNAERPWATKRARGSADPDPGLSQAKARALAAELRCRKTGTPAQVVRVEIPGATPPAPTSRLEYRCPACGVQSTGTLLHFGQHPPGRAEEIEAEEERLGLNAAPGDDPAQRHAIDPGLWK